MSINVTANDTIEIMQPYARYKVVAVAKNKLRLIEYKQASFEIDSDEFGKELSMSMSTLETHARNGNLYINTVQIKL